MNILEQIAAGNYHEPGGLRAMHLGAVDRDLVTQLREDMVVLANEHRPSVVKAGKHVTGWARPVGQVRQWSLFNRHGRRTDDTSDDFTYGRHIAAKRPLPLPGITALASGLPSLVNMRLNVIWPGSALSPHEEHLPRPIGQHDVALRARFHLPLVTTTDALMLADEHLLHFEAGQVWFFNNGCVHGASNDGPIPRAHLVWDQLMTQKALDTMFGDTPPDWLAPDRRPAEPVRTVEVADWAPSQGMTRAEFDRRRLVVHP